jgi:hypothetical protein
MFNREKRKYFNENIDVILNDLKYNERKAYIIKEDNSSKNPISKAINNIIPYIQEQESGSSVNAISSLNPFSSKQYAGFTFSKDGDELILSAVAIFLVHTGEYGKHLHLDLLQGAGGAGLIINLVKDIVEHKIKHPMTDLNNIDYMDLIAVPTANTLNFYDKKDGLVPDYDIKKLDDDIKSVLVNLDDDAIKELAEIRNLPHKTEEEIKHKDERIYYFWDNHFDPNLSTVPYYFFYNTPKSQEDKKKIAKAYEKTEVKKRLPKNIKELEDEYIDT